MPVRHARSETRGRPPFGRRGWNRQERFDKIPQRIWKQRGGHNRSHYPAEEDQMSEVLLHAFRTFLSGSVWRYAAGLRRVGLIGGSAYC